MQGDAKAFFHIYAKHQMCVHKWKGMWVGSRACICNLQTKS